MEQKDHKNGLHQKVRLGQEEGQARAVSLGRALRLTLAKVGEERFDLPLAVLGVTSKLRSNGDLPKALGEGNLLLVLDGPEGARGGVVVEESVVAGLIQQQTMGKVIAPNGAPARTLTPTDAAICAPLIDAVLSRAALLPDAQKDRKLLEGFRFGAGVPDPRLMLMALEAPSYVVVEITIDMAAGTRQGVLKLILPEVSLRSSPAARLPKAAEDAPKIGALEETVMRLKVDLPVVLSRVSVPLSRISSLQVGELLEVPRANFDAVRLQTSDGKVIAVGMLGKSNLQRALRIVPQKPVSNIPKRRGGDAAELGLADPEPGAFQSLSAPSAGAMASPGADLPDALEIGIGKGPEEIITVDDLPDLPDLPAMDDLPDLPDLDGLPDLPDLPPIT